MKIYATFANRKHDPESVELVDAWDEFCFDENPTGFEESKDRALASWGDDLLRWVTVEIDVEAADIYEALDPAITTRGHVGHVEPAIEADRV